jgi:hypothetical protein
MSRGAFTLAPIGDIQYGSQGCAEDMLKAHIQKGIENDWWFLGAGDYLDHLSPSNRSALAAAKVSLYESAHELIDSAIHDRVRSLATGPLKGSEGRWMGLVAGDHIWTYGDGQSSDHHLAQMMKAPYLGHSAIVSVHQKGVDRPLRIFITHGRGASVSSTGKTLHLERLLSAFDVDVVLMGHAHLRYGVVKERIQTVTTKTGSKLYARKKVAGVTGSFLKGYEESTRTGPVAGGSYVEQAALAPVSLGGILVHCEPVKHEWGWEWELSVTA